MPGAGAPGAVLVLVLVVVVVVAGAWSGVADVPDVDPGGVRVLEVWRKCGACWWKFGRGAGVRVLVEILGGRCCAL